ncbi:SdpI family protein [Gordonia araii]|uniref:SdpI family protein n=1 Tax=Gordonia araii TaxID=263909 RepID=UPI0002FFA2F0|nr:SdpI family protein [Gordonia araii]NNG96128.1 SdpI family protein [Gordonia araii NBRC 100433]
MVDVFALVVATIAAVSGLAWIVLGIAGWTGILRRNRYFGIRSAETMRSEQAFATANRVVAPGLIATGLLALVAAGLAVSERGLAGIVLGVIGTVVALALVGLLSGTAIKAAAAVPVPDDDQPAGCGSECGCGGQSGPDADDTEARADDEPDICGTGTTCGSCEMRDACFDDAERARA